MPTQPASLLSGDKKKGNDEVAIWERDSENRTRSHQRPKPLYPPSSAAISVPFLANIESNKHD